MSLRLTNGRPIYFGPRRLSLIEKEQLGKILDKLLSRGIIRESESPYASPIVLARKKNSEYRLCVDYRFLNKITLRDNYPLPLIEDQIDKLHDKIFFTLLGLKTMRAKFQRFINAIFSELIKSGEVIIYLDNILVASKTLEHHFEILKRVFNLMVENKLGLRLDKCKFIQTKIDYLGYKISENGVSPTNHGIEAVLNFPIAQNIREVQSFLGWCSYFRKFIEGFSIIAKPLYDLLRKNMPFKFGPDELQAVEKLKNKLIDFPVLSICSPKDKTELHYDASKLGYGAALLQRKSDGLFHPVFYFSKRTTEVESRYHSFELETLAIIYALRRFRIYLQGIPFKIVTDCNALKLTLDKKYINPRISR